MSIFEPNAHIRIGRLQDLFHYAYYWEVPDKLFPTYRIICDALKSGALTAYGKRLTSSKVEQIPKQQLATLELDVSKLCHHSVNHVQASPPSSEAFHPANQDYKENCWHSIFFETKEVLDRFRNGYYRVTYPQKEDAAQLFYWIGNKDKAGEIFPTCIVPITSQVDASLTEALTLIAYGVALSSDRYNDDLTPIVLGFYDQSMFDAAMREAWTKLRDACLRGKIILKGKPENTARHENIPAIVFHNEDVGPAFFDNTISDNPRGIDRILGGQIDKSWSDVKVMTDELRQMFPEVNTPIWLRGKVDPATGEAPVRKTIKAETTCTGWLGEQLDAADPKVKSKETFRNDALSRFPGLGKNGFTRAWATATQKRPQWHMSGAKKKSIR